MEERSKHSDDEYDSILSGNNDLPQKEEELFDGNLKNSSTKESSASEYTRESGSAEEEEILLGNLKNSSTKESSASEYTRGSGSAEEEELFHGNLKNLSTKESSAFEYTRESGSAEEEEIFHVKNSSTKESSASEYTRGSGSAEEEELFHGNLKNLSTKEPSAFEYTRESGSEEEEEIFHGNLRNSSTKESSASEYTRESGSDLSMYVVDSEDDDGLESVLQLGCMDVFFLPTNAKNMPKKSLIKTNGEGKKELNINVKGALARGFEAKMKNEEGKRGLNATKSFGSVLQDTVTCGLHEDKITRDEARHLRSVLQDTVTCGLHKDMIARDEASEPEHFRSLMSLSHGSSEDDDCDNSVIPQNQVLPSTLHHFNKQQHYHDFLSQQFQQEFLQQYNHHYGIQQQQNLQEANYPYEMLANGRMSPSHSSRDSNIAQTDQRVHQKTSQIKPLRSPLSSTGSIQSQILVEEQYVFDEENSLVQQRAMAPDPPTSALPRIEEGESLDSGSEEGSYSSMEARGSMVSETQDNPTIESPKTSSANVAEENTSQTKGGKLSKVERWRRANNKRLKTNQQKTESDESVQSAATSKRGKGNQSLAFDNIFTRRIERRRATKHERNDSEENPSDPKQGSTNDQTENNPALQGDFAENSAVQGISDSSSHEGISKPMSSTPNRNPPPKKSEKIIPGDGSLCAPSVIDAVAAAAALALNKDFQPIEQKEYPSMEDPSYPSMEDPSYPSMESPSIDNDDSENQAPPPVVEGNKRSTDALPTKAEVLEDDKKDNTFERRPKNPFQDDDILDDEISYNISTDTNSNSDDADVLQPLVIQTDSFGDSFHSARCLPSPLVSPRGAVISMTPSPRHSSRLVSPRYNSEWNDTVNRLSNRMASTTLQK
jgi:hypothetical protein